MNNLVMESAIADDVNIFLSESSIIEKIEQQHIESIITELGINRYNFFKSGGKKYTREDIENFNLIIQEAKDRHNISPVNSFLILSASYVDLHRATKILSQPIFIQIKQELGARYRIKGSKNKNTLLSFFN